MRIAQIDIYAHQLSYAGGTFAMSRERTVAIESSTLVRVSTDEGITGWGEACPLAGTYLPAFTGGVRAALAVLAPTLIGADACNLADVRRRMDRALLGQPAAKSPLDIGCWDILGRASGQPLATLLGGRVSEQLPLYLAVASGTPDEMLERVREAWGRGCADFS